MKKLLLALLAVALLAVLAVAVVEIMPERRMDRRYDRLLRTYDDPKQLYQRVVDDKDLLGLVLVELFMMYNELDRCSCGARAASSFSVRHQDDCDFMTYWKQCKELFDDFNAQIEAALCDCGRAPRHPADCNSQRASRDMWTTWGPYIMRKEKEFYEAQLNR